MLKSTVVIAMLAALVHPLAVAAQDQAKIAGALAAAPTSISSGATVMDWDQRVLKQGTNGWTCMPDFPDSVGNDPMCLDAPWVEWAHAYMNQQPLQVSRMGFGYMLAGDASASNTDPYATGPTVDNEWLSQGMPHVMVIVPEARMLDGLPTHPRDGGPWVMWRNTPYVHIMVPLAGPGQQIMAH